MKINSDFKDLLQSLNAAGVRYLIVGGYAVMVHTEPCYTKDLDVWIETDQYGVTAPASATVMLPTRGHRPSFTGYTHSSGLDEGKPGW